MKTAFRALALVLFASVSEISLAAEPEPLEPITRPRVVFWESENFVFTVHARCTVDFDGLFASRRCDGATIYVESSLTFDDQRLEPIKSGRNGERRYRRSELDPRTSAAYLKRRTFKKVDKTTDDLLVESFFDDE